MVWVKWFDLKSGVGPPHSKELRGAGAGSAAARSSLVSEAASALGFFLIEMSIGFREKFFDAFAIATVDRDADAGGELRLFHVLSQNLVNALCYAFRFFLLRLR